MICVFFEIKKWTTRIVSPLVTPFKTPLTFVQKPAGCPALELGMPRWRKTCAREKRSKQITAVQLDASVLILEAAPSQKLVEGWASVKWGSDKKKFRNKAKTQTLCDLIPWSSKEVVWGWWDVFMSFEESPRRQWPGVRILDLREGHATEGNMSSWNAADFPFCEGAVCLSVRVRGLHHPHQGLSSSFLLDLRGEFTSLILRGPQAPAVSLHRLSHQCLSLLWWQPPFLESSLLI